MNTFAQLLRGGDSGEVVVPGASAASLLIQKLRGLSGDRMPSGGRPPLPDESINLIATWIDEGASLNGGDPEQLLSVMSELAWAASATPEEKTERRAALAGEHWRRAFPREEQPSVIDTDHFHVVGSRHVTDLEQVAAAAEKEWAAVRRLIDGPAGDAYFGGRATLIVVARRYDYNEFAKMVEGRDVPSEWSAHWQFDGRDAYAVVIVAEHDDSDTIAARLIGPLTSLALATRRVAVPRWLAEGIGVATAWQRAPPRDRQMLQQRDADTLEAIGAMQNVQSFLDGRLTPQQADRIAATVAATLIDRSRRNKFDQLVRGLEQGTTFDESFRQAYGKTLMEYLAEWLAWVRGGR